MRAPKQEEPAKPKKEEEAPAAAAPKQVAVEKANLPNVSDDGEHRDTTNATHAYGRHAQTEETKKEESDTESEGEEEVKPKHKSVKKEAAPAAKHHSKKVTKETKKHYAKTVPADEDTSATPKSHKAHAQVFADPDAEKEKD